MATTMRLIAKNVLGSDTASVTFSDIPGTYTDLYLVVSARSSNTAGPGYYDGIKARFNGASDDTNHSSRLLYGGGVSAGSLTLSNARVGGMTAANATASTFGNNEVCIPNYAGSTNKSYSATTVTESNTATSDYTYQMAIAGLWSGTAAITSITLLPDVGANFKSGSSFFLYGITKA